MRKIAATLFLSLITTAAFAAEGNTAQDVSWLGSWLSQSKATGDWKGYRNTLKDAGITLSSNYSTDIGGNPVGGLDQVTRYSGFLSLAAALDFQKMASIKGLALTVSNYLASGRNLSTAIGNFYGVQQVYTSGGYYFGELDLSLSVLDDKMLFEVGRIFAGDVFAVSPMYQYYLTSAVNGRPAAIVSNVFFPHYRTAAWGTRFSYQPNKDWQFITGLYNADSGVAEPGTHGADFSLDLGQGCLAVGQLTYKHGQDKNKGGLPGSATFGGYYESSRFTDLSDPSKRRHGNYGLYFIADQMIYKGEWPEYEGPFHKRSGAMFAEQRRQPYHQQTTVPLDRPKGLTLWGTAVLAPQENINIQTYELVAGLVYQGLPPNRNRDATAFCFVLGHFSEDLQGQGNEMVLELNHRFQLGPWAYITPDIQYVINPNGQRNIKDSLVLGLETSFDF
ncbi:MAG: carbohydrate porin [Candidatus Omnitrophota bacterium]|jgi:porin